MKQNQLFKKIGKIAIIAGTAAIALSIICFIGLGIASARVEEAVGYKPTASELGDIIDRAKETAEFFGGNLKDIADFVGISAFELGLVQFFLAVKLPFLVIGIVMLICGAVLVFLVKKPDMAKKIGDSVAHGAATVGCAVKTTIDNATVKCEKCGKTFVAGTKFCSNCGAGLAKEPEAPKMKKCPKCEAEILDNSKFCSVCGAVIEDETKVDSEATV